MQRAGTTSELRVRPASARTPAEDCAGETPLDEFRTLAGILTLRGTDAGTATAGLSVSNVVPSVAPAPSSSASVATPPPPSAASSRSVHA